MNISRFKFKFQNKLNWLNKAFKSIGLAWNYVVIIFFMLLIILLMSINIFDVYQRGKKNLDQLEMEAELLDKLLLENNLLSEELEYYKSKDFIEIFAHESLGLGKTTEQLLKFDRTGDITYDLEDPNTDPIILEENLVWWKKIFLW